MEEKTYKYTSDEVKKIFRSREIPLIDYHTHSVNKYTQQLNPNFEDGPRLAILNDAIDLGLEVFGFADHSYELIRYSYLEEDNILNANGLESLKKYIEFQKQMQDEYGLQTRISRGMELYIDGISISQLPLELLREFEHILIESHSLKANVKELREQLPDTILIYAHPAIELICDDGSTFNKWLSDLSQANIYFEINRQNLKKYNDSETSHKWLFNALRDHGVKLTIGSDFHYSAKYLKFLNNLVETIEKYDLVKDDFIVV